MEQRVERGGIFGPEGDGGSDGEPGNAEHFSQGQGVGTGAVQLSPGIVATARRKCGHPCDGWGRRFLKLVHGGLVFVATKTTAETPSHEGAKNHAKDSYLRVATMDQSDLAAANHFFSSEALKPSSWSLRSASLIRLR